MLRLQDGDLREMQSDARARPATDVRPEVTNGHLLSDRVGQGTERA